jgi:hypothetical protein
VSCRRQTPPLTVETMEATTPRPHPIGPPTPWEFIMTAFHERDPRDAVLGHLPGPP